MSSITVEVPDQIVQQLESEGWQDLPRRALEAIALEAYRQEILSSGQVGKMLGMSFTEKEAFLKEHEAYLHYGLHELEQDAETLRRLREKKTGNA
jgi:predicted HTH domain antitoxin